MIDDVSSEKKDYKLSVEQRYENEFVRFLLTWFFSTDHKVIAKQYLFTGIFWAFAGGVLSVIIRFQLGFPHVDLSFAEHLAGTMVVEGRLNPEFYLSALTMHGTIMIFFVLTGGFIGSLGNYLIPLQIGAKEMASGFINMISYWLFFSASILLLISFIVDSGAAAAGWTAYPPLSVLKEASKGSGAGMTLWIISLVFFILSTTLSAINFLATIVNLRATGMSFTRLPLTIWAFLFTSVLSLLSFPVLLTALLLLFFDREFGTSFYLSDIFIDGALLPNSGGSALLYQHLFWFLGHPEVYISILPAFGIISEVISVNCRKPIFGYPAMVTSMFAIVVLSFIVWAHHMFVTGLNPFLGSVFSLTSFIIAVPSSIKVFNWLGTLWRGNIHFPPPMLFAIGMISFFITGGLTGFYLANPAIDMQMHDTYFVVAHFHMVMGSAAFFGFLCGVYHWYPSMFGRSMNSSLGYLHFWITFVGVYLIFFPMHFMGLSGLPRRYYSFSYFDAFNLYANLNTFITVAAILTFAAQFIFLYNFFSSLLWGERAPLNPWRATTLEWATTTEPLIVYRWPYDYRISPDTDFIPQNVPDTQNPNHDK